jgi:hypothetical protein
VSKLNNNGKELPRIVTIVGNRVEGCSIEDIENELEFSIDRRTLQRRLKELIETGIVASFGKGRAIKYKLVKNEENVIPASQLTEQIELLPLSKQGKEIQLISLHEGNFARYSVTPSQFRNWQSGVKSGFWPYLDLTLV